MVVGLAVQSSAAGANCVAVRLDMRADGGRAPSHALLTCEPGAVELTAGEEAQLFQLPRVSSEIGADVRVELTVGAKWEAMCHDVAELYADGTILSEAGTPGKPAIFRLDTPGLVALTVTLRGPGALSGASLMFPLSEAPCDTTVRSLQRATELTTVQRAVTTLNISTAQLLRLNFGAAWHEHQNSVRDGHRCPQMTCEAFDKTLQAFATSLDELNLQRRQLEPTALHADTVSLFDIDGTVAGAKCAFGALATQDRTRCVSNATALRRVAARCSQHWAVLAQATLPPGRSVVDFYNTRQAALGATELNTQLDALLALRELQVSKIAALRPERRPLMAGARVGHANTQVWQGRAYADIANVRCHYVGLGAVDAALHRLCCRVDGSEAFRQTSVTLLPPAAFRRQLEQLLAKNATDDVALDEKVYAENVALVTRVNADADPRFSFQMPSPARQVRVAAMLAAVLGAAASGGLGHQAANGTCASPIQTADTAAKLPRAPHLERLSPSDSAQHLALCQLHALVNTDRLHRITPPALHRRIVGCLEAVAQELGRDATAFRALRDTVAWRARSDGVVALFAAPVRPLATLALTGRKPEGCALAFLDAPEVHTGYDADACLASLVDALLEDPRAGRGHTAGAARGI